MRILFIIILLFFFIYFIRKQYFTNIIGNNICCLYAYYEKDDNYKNNFTYFLQNGILPNVDYYIIINGNFTVELPSSNNINVNVIRRENKGYDFGAWSSGIKNIQKSYNYYFFINTSVCGPYLQDNTKPWIDYFLELFNTPMVKVVGTSINIFPSNTFGVYDLTQIYNKQAPFSHVQSMFFCVNKEYFDYLSSIQFFNEDECNNAIDIHYIISYKEIGLSQNAIKNGWNINCILQNYKNLDYTQIFSNINTSSPGGDPYFPNTYFGKTIDKYDVIFFKNNRFNDN